MSQLTWSTLEANPEVLTRFLRRLGVSKDWEFIDILSFDVDYLEFIPRPVIAVLLLFPLIDNTDVSGNENTTKNSDNSIYFIPQTIPNACGTIALIHAIANNLNNLTFEPSSVVYKFIEETKNLTEEKKSHLLEINEEINTAHEATAWEDETERPSWLNDSACKHHYITLVQINSKLYEFDGLKSIPTQHKHTTEATFLEDAAKICQEYMKRNQNDVKFNAMALVKN